MEEVKISYVSHYRHDDFDELNVRINDAPARPASSQLADDAHNVYLQIDAENQRVIGATILYADDWFEEIAQAFQRHDLDHPDVCFFFEQKIKAFAAQWETGQHTQTLAPTQLEPRRVTPVDDPAPTTNKVVETQPA